MATGNDSYMGLAVPLYGDFELKQRTAATDALTLTGVASQTGDFLVLRDSDLGERFVVEDGGNVVIDLGAAGDIALRIQSAASQTGNFLTLENSAGTDITTISSDGALYTGRDTTTGQVTAGGTTMVYGRGTQRTNALTGDLIGVRGNARVVVASAAGAAYGGYFQAGSGSSATGADAVNVSQLYGVLAEIVTASASATVEAAYGLKVSMDIDAATTAITTAIGAWISMGSGSSGGAVTNAAGVVIINEDVQGTGQEYDAGLAIGNISRAVGFTYLIDLNPSILLHGTTGTVVGCSGHNADIRFSNNAWLVALATAISANSTTTSAPAGSLGFTTHATGNTKWFMSDGTKWQYAAVA